MKVAILHHDLEPSETAIKRFLEDEGIETSLIDIRIAKLEHFKNIDLVLNRVYASVANKDYASTQKALLLLKQLEEKGSECINSYATSLYDYSKFESYKVLAQNNILTPKSLLIKSTDNINEFCKLAEKQLGLPIIIKRNTGGRAVDISRVENKIDLEKSLKEKFKQAQKESYIGGFIVQEFIKPIKSHDFRIGVINGEFSFSFKRSFIPFDSDDCWLASASRGSILEDYAATKQEIETAINANNLINAKCNDIDMIMSEQGPVVIEYNPTPNYFMDDPDDVERLVRFLHSIVQRS